MPRFLRLAISTSRVRGISGAVLLVSVLTHARASAAATTVLKFGYILTAESQLGRGEQVFAAEIAKRTGGRYTIENYPDAMLGGETAMIRDVQLGALDLAFITGAPLSTVVPPVGIFNLPFLFPNTAAARTVLDGPIGADYLGLLANADIVGLAWGENGMRQLTNSKRPIRTPADLKGLKIRLPQSNIMTTGFQALDAKVEQIPFPEVYGALRNGRVDGEENPIATIVSARFYEVQKYLTLSSHVYDPAVIMMSKDAFAALSEIDKAAFVQSARLAGEESRKAASEAERSELATLEASGMVVTRDVDRAAFAEAIAAASPTFDRIFGREAIARLASAAHDAKIAHPVQAAP